MKTILLAFIACTVLLKASGQNATAIAVNDLQYIKSFFAANFIKSPVSEVGKTTTERYDYEITDEAIIVYKTELSHTTAANMYHWYYLPLGNIRIKNYNTNLNYFNGTKAIWFEHKKGSLPHGIDKKFTKLSDAAYMSGWLRIPFKYNTYRDLDKLRDMLEMPTTNNQTASTKPVTEIKESYLFKNSFLSNLFEISYQLKDNNVEAVMKAHDYTLKQPIDKSSQIFSYKHQTQRSIYFSEAHSDTSLVQILYAMYLGVEMDEIMNDLKNNGIQYAGTKSDEESDDYYFTKPGSNYIFEFQENKNNAFKYLNIYKETEKVTKKTAAEQDMFAGIKVSDVMSMEVFNAFTVKDKKYSIQKTTDVASFFNTQMANASMRSDKNMQSFITLGKIDFANRSLAFIVKDNELYIKINLPLNGTCDYALKEIKMSDAVISEPYTRGVDNGYYLIIPYNYSCAGNQYKNLYMYIVDTKMESYNIIKRYFEKVKD